MNDSDFKNAEHPIGSLKIATKGSEVSKGYKPDVTIHDKDGVLKFILESETKTDRKAFLGDLLKAEMHAEKNNVFPILIIVMQPSDNTTTLQISDHLRPYKEWLKEKKNGKLNLTGVQILSDTEYQEAIENKETLESIEFKKRGHII